MIRNPLMDKKEEEVIGLIGMIISLIGISLSIKHKKKILGVLFSITFIFSSWLFFTGTKNYSVAMLGASDLKDEYPYKGAVIHVIDKGSLKKLMIENGKYFLWLSCEHGGVWWKPSAYFLTRWTLPSKNLVCPTGRVLIQYDGKNL